jgi:hypothetical protein
MTHTDSMLPLIATPPLPETYGSSLLSVGRNFLMQAV